MEVSVKLFGGLEKHIPGARYAKPLVISMPEGSTVQDLLKHLGVPPGEVFTVLLNGVHRRMEDTLKPGDQISLFPPVGGG